MYAVVKEYGGLIVSVLMGAVILLAGFYVLGMFETSIPALNGQESSGNGIAGKLICAWLNRIM